MYFLPETIEYLLGRSVASIRHHDAKLFTRTPAFTNQAEPTIAVTSPECQGPDAHLKIEHTPMGHNRFPSIECNMFEAGGESQVGSIEEYMLIVEDPDAPLPMPVVHGIYYAIPYGKTALSPEDFAPVPEAGNMLRGGFRFGRNRMKSVWGGPKPVLGHGPHRYMFQVVGLRSVLDTGTLSHIPTRAELEKAVQGKVVAWGLWIGTFERNLT